MPSNIVRITRIAAAPRLKSRLITKAPAGGLIQAKEPWYRDGTRGAITDLCLKPQEITPLRGLGVRLRRTVRRKGAGAVFALGSFRGRPGPRFGIEGSVCLAFTF